MARLLIWGLLAYALWRMLRHVFRLQANARSKMGQAKTEGIDDILVEDPICGARVPRQQAIVSRSWGKTTYYCSSVCAEKAHRMASNP